MVLMRNIILVTSVRNHMLDFVLFKDTCFFMMIKSVQLNINDNWFLIYNICELIQFTQVAKIILNITKIHKCTKMYNIQDFINNLTF